ncbi:hypothetical protein T310_2449 [Rasamsonia emersonii CBS 393.64]|uniref:Uncharacterized protein n=1 Tax=Rasamsonia emersonii (strain ATCC 16479 / CBS 393.64 / IMI 116815) TaxID=1408163 RepID=A0A0F4YZ00_RASE3|nr:hypothetical protein T310_2449 [Rasamsonia emersonii CBS 393.64]KKA23522.1 hypothetical protein T310_2449 [Rasamsonia emersonii CBS 393.64]
MDIRTARLITLYRQEGLLSCYCSATATATTSSTTTVDTCLGRVHATTTVVCRYEGTVAISNKVYHEVCTGPDLDTTTESPTTDRKMDHGNWEGPKIDS